MTRKEYYPGLARVRSEVVQSCSICTLSCWFWSPFPGAVVVGRTLSNMVGIVHSISKKELSKAHLWKINEKLIFYSSEYTSPDVFTLFMADDLQTSRILQIYFSLHSSSIWQPHSLQQKVLLLVPKLLTLHTPIKFHPISITLPDNPAPAMWTPSPPSRHLGLREFICLILYFCASH